MAISQKTAEYVATLQSAGFTGSIADMRANLAVLRADIKGMEVTSEAFTLTSARIRDGEAALAETVGQTRALKAEVASVGTDYMRLGAEALAAGFALKKVWDISKEAAANEQALDTFNASLARMGIVGSAELQKLRAASKDMIDDQTLVADTDKFIAMGLPIARLPELLDDAAKLSTKFGGTVQEDFDKISEATESMTSRGLKHEGILVDTAIAYKRYADSIGVAVDKLTIEQKQTVFFNEVMDQARQRTADVDLAVLNASERMQQLSTSLGNVAAVGKKFVMEFLVQGLVGIEKFDAGILEFVGDIGRFFGHKWTSVEDASKKGYAEAQQLVDMLKGINNGDAKSEVGWSVGAGMLTKFGAAGEEAAKSVKKFGATGEEAAKSVEPLYKSLTDGKNALNDLTPGTAAYVAELVKVNALTKQYNDLIAQSQARAADLANPKDMSAGIDKLGKNLDDLTLGTKGAFTAFATLGAGVRKDFMDMSDSSGAFRNAFALDNGLTRAEIDKTNKAQEEAAHKFIEDNKYWMEIAKDGFDNINKNLTKFTNNLVGSTSVFQQWLSGMLQGLEKLAIQLTEDVALAALLSIFSGGSTTFAGAFGSIAPKGLNTLFSGLGAAGGGLGAAGGGLGAAGGGSGAAGGTPVDDGGSLSVTAANRLRALGNQPGGASAETSGGHTYITVNVNAPGTPAEFVVGAIQEYLRGTGQANASAIINPRAGMGLA